MTAKFDLSNLQYQTFFQFSFYLAGNNFKRFTFICNLRKLF